MIMYRIVLIGSDGPIGQRLSQYLFRHDRVILNISYTDIVQNSCSWLQYKISTLKPDLVISGLDLYNDFSESFHPKISLDTDTNIHTLQDLALAIGKSAAFVGSPVIWLSDAEVFGSSNPAPYQECHSPAPTTGFGNIALSAERLILELAPASVILRTQWISGVNITGFFQSMLMLARRFRPEISVIDGSLGGPTFLADLGAAVSQIASHILTDKAGTVWRGTFHFSGKPATTWPDFAEAIFAEMADRGHAVPKVKVMALPDKHPRHDCRLDGSRLASVFGLHPPNWRVSLQQELGYTYD